MRFERLDLNLLAVLDAVLDERHVGQAAVRLNLSQPAMSNALARLRRFLDDPLLVRSGNGLVLTPRGEELRGLVRNILPRIRAELIVRPGFDPAASNRCFTIAASDYTIRTLLLPCFRRLYQEAPRLTFKVLPLGSDVRDAFGRGDTDLLIAPLRIVSPDHPYETLFEDDYVVAAWTGNRRVTQDFGAGDYFSMGHVNASFGKTGMAAFDEWLEQSSTQRRRIEIAVPSFRDVPEMLIATERIATMHRRYSSDFAMSLPIRLLPLPFEHPLLVQVAQWHQLRGGDHGIRWLVTALKTEAQPAHGACNDIYGDAWT